MKYTIWNTSFSFEKKAGTMITSYVSEIQDYFKKTWDKETLIDIEFAIIDKLESIIIHRADKKIIVSDVEWLIRELWTVEMITEESDIPNNEIVVGKKLYRDIDDKIIAWVSSGLAHYFGINPWIIRLIFLWGLFLPFPSIIPYIILWFLLPMARTKIDILRMKWIPVSLSSLSSDNENYTSRRVISIAKFILITILVIGLFVLSAFSLLYFFVSKNVDTMSGYDETSYFYSCDSDNNQVDLKITYPYMWNNISIWDKEFNFNIEEKTEVYIWFKWEARIELEQKSEGKYIWKSYELIDDSWDRTNPIVIKDGKEIFSKCSILSIQDTDGNLIDFLNRDADTCFDKGLVWDKKQQKCLWDEQKSSWIMDK